MHHLLLSFIIFSHNLLYFFTNSYWRMTPNSFLCRLNLAEEQAMKMLLPGLHISVIPRKAQQEQEWTVLQQFEIPCCDHQSHGDVSANNELPTEVSVGTCIHPSTSLLLALWGTVMMQPVTSTKPFNASTVAASNVPTHNIRQLTSNHLALDLHGCSVAGIAVFSSFFEAMSKMHM